MNLDQRSKWTNKDSTIKDSIIYIVHFEKCWKKYPNKKGKGKISDSKKKEIFKLGEEFERCIERYILYVDTQRKNGFNLNYQNGSTFFNSGYMDYLDANYEESEDVTPKNNTSYNDPYAGMEIIT